MKNYRGGVSGEQEGNFKAKKKVGNWCRWDAARAVWQKKVSLWLEEPDLPSYVMLKSGFGSSQAEDCGTSPPWMRPSGERARRRRGAVRERERENERERETVCIGGRELVRTH